MATKKQKEAAMINIRNAQAAWKAMSSTERARSQPEGRERKKPGETGEGAYYRIVVRSKEILKVIGPAKHVKGDIFQGHPRKNVPEREKPTPAQQRARMKNLSRAWQARQA